jgi:hypothetical protein
MGGTGGGNSLKYWASEKISSRQPTSQSELGGNEIWELGKKKWW